MFHCDNLTDYSHLWSYRRQFYIVIQPHLNNISKIFLHILVFKHVINQMRTGKKLSKLLLVEYSDLTSLSFVN